MNLTTEENLRLIEDPQYKEILVGFEQFFNRVDDLEPGILGVLKGFRVQPGETAGVRRMLEKMCAKFMKQHRKHPPGELEVARFVVTTIRDIDYHLRQLGYHNTPGARFQRYLNR